MRLNDLVTNLADHFGAMSESDKSEFKDDVNADFAKIRTPMVLASEKGGNGKRLDPKYEAKTFWEKIILNTDKWQARLIIMVVNVMLVSWLERLQNPLELDEED